MTCTWCLTDSSEAAKHHEGPHATWCPLYVSKPCPPLLRPYLKALSEKYATPTPSVDAAPSPQIPPTDPPAE